MPCVLSHRHWTEFLQHREDQCHFHFLRSGLSFSLRELRTASFQGARSQPSAVGVRCASVPTRIPVLLRPVNVDVWIRAALTRIGAAIPPESACAGVLFPSKPV